APGGAVGPGVGLGRGPAVADERVLVEVGRPDEHGPERRRRSARRMEGRATEVRAADHSDLAAREGLAREPLDEVVTVLRLGPVLEAPAGAERRALPANVGDRDDVPRTQQRTERQPVAESRLRNRAVLVPEAGAVRREGEHDRQRRRDSSAVLGWTIDVYGKAGAIADGNVSRLAHDVGDAFRRSG